MNQRTAPEGLGRAIEQHQIATSQFINGDTRLWKELCAKQDEVTIFGGWGGYELGWEPVRARYEWAAARFQNSGGRVEIENVSLVATADLAYTVDIERSKVRLEGRDEIVPMALRVTTVYRRENQEWKMVHRQADNLFAIQATDSVIERK